jgi:hypothetical protein
MVGALPSADLVVVWLGLSRPDQAFDPGELIADVLAALTRPSGPRALPAGVASSLRRMPERRALYPWQPSGFGLMIDWGPIRLASSGQAIMSSATRGDDAQF